MTNGETSETTTDESPPAESHRVPQALERLALVLGLGLAVGGLFVLPVWAVLITLGCCLLAYATFTHRLRMMLVVAGALLLVGAGVVVNLQQSKPQPSPFAGLDRRMSRINQQLRALRHPQRETADSGALADLRSEVRQNLNAERLKVGVPPVSETRTLDDFAQRHSVQMAARGELSHSRDFSRLLRGDVTSCSELVGSGQTWQEVLGWLVRGQGISSVKFPEATGVGLGFSFGVKGDVFVTIIIIPGPPPAVPLPRLSG
jgi:hypothetical protein